jgi:hypothetical protein
MLCQRIEKKKFQQNEIQWLFHNFFCHYWIAAGTDEPEFFARDP